MEKLKKLRITRRYKNKAGRSIIEQMIDDLPIKFVEPGTVIDQMAEHSKKVYAGDVCKCGSPVFNKRCIMAHTVTGYTGHIHTY